MVAEHGDIAVKILDLVTWADTFEISVNLMQSDTDSFKIMDSIKTGIQGLVGVTQASNNLTKRLSVVVVKARCYWSANPPSYLAGVGLSSSSHIASCLGLERPWGTDKGILNPYCASVAMPRAPCTFWTRSTQAMRSSSRSFLMFWAWMICC